MQDVMPLFENCSPVSATGVCGGKEVIFPKIKNRFSAVTWTRIFINMGMARLLQTCIGTRLATVQQ